jgi:hypothetical protein
MDDQGKALTRRITLAEDWLARARRQVEEGERARGVLTLLLAEAEVHRAREAGMEARALPPRPAPSLRAPVAGVLAAATIVAAVALWRPFVPASPSSAEAGEVSPYRIVTLAAGTGTLLGLVQVQAAPEERVVIVSVPPPGDRTRSASPSPVASPQSRRAAPASLPGTAKHVAPGRTEPSLVAPATSVASPGAVETPALLSEADLIDLVLAAERSLRRSSNQ